MELTLLADDELWDLAAGVRAEQRRRSLESGDLEAVVEDAFVRGFDARGMATDPWIAPGGLVVCPGSKIGRSRSAHRCRFVALTDCWVWESGERVCDEVRPLLDGRDSLQTVTVLAPWEGLTLDVITSKASAGVHTRDAAHAFELRGGRLEPAPASSTLGGHPRR